MNKKIKGISISLLMFFCLSFILNLNVRAWELNIDYKKETQELCGWTQAGHYDTITGSWVDCYVRGQKYYLQFFGTNEFNSSTFLYGTGTSSGQVKNDRYDCKKITNWPEGDYQCTKKAFFRTSNQYGVQQTHKTKASFYKPAVSGKWEVINQSYILADFKAGRKTLNSAATSCSFNETNENTKTTNGADLLLMGKGLSCSFSATKTGTYTVYVKASLGTYYKYVITVSNEYPLVSGGGQKNSCGLDEAVKKYSSKTWTENECNKLTDADYYSIWDKNNSCCKFSKRNTITYNDNTACNKAGNYYNTDTSKAEKGCYDISNEFNCNYFGFCWNNGKCDKECKSATQTENTYTASFYENGGAGLVCDSGWLMPSAGVCSISGIKKDESVNVPSSTNTMYSSSDNNLLLVGWTKSDCRTENLIKGTSVNISDNENYYACYKEDIGGYRYLQAGYATDGQTQLCGTSLYIEYCTREKSGFYCYYYDHDNNTYVKVYRNGLAENTDAGKAAAISSCNSLSNAKTINKYKYALINGKDYSCGEKLYITTCTDDICIYNKISKNNGSEVTVDNQTINIENLTDNSNTSKKTCEKINVDETDKKCTNKTDSDNRGTDKYTVCYEYGSSKSKIKSTIKKYYSCADGYKLDETSIYADSRESCNDKKTYCSRTYEVTCTRSEGKYKPTLEVSSGNIGSDGKTGTIKVHAKSTEGRIARYYVSQEYKVPTDTSIDPYTNIGWVNTNSDTFTITKTPGIYYIWVEDVKGNISNGIGGAVFDTVNADTTLIDLEFKDSNGQLQTPTGNIAYKVEGITSSSYVRLSNNLVNDSVIAENGFNPYTMEYKLEVNSPTISVYATLTSNDASYVNGYEPRTVNLDYGMNTILIKIQNKEGKVRTYTILVNRVDGRTADNTLSDLSIDVGKIDFNSNKTEYKIEIPTDTEKVNVNATIGNDKATFVDGYKPGIVNINGDTTVNFIKVMSETGSTRTYVLTFIKEGTDIIEKGNLMLSDLVIPGVYVPFEEKIVNYNISVAYETELINLNYDLKDDDSTATIYYKGKNDSEYRSSSNQGIKLDVGENFVEIKIVNKDGEESFYRLTIIRKEFGLGISDDTTLKDLSVLGYDIDYEPNKKEYTVRIKQEKSLVITAIPNSDRSEVFIRGNDELTGFSTVRVKIVAENGEFDTYSIDIKKDAFNKTIEIAAIIAGVVIILGSSCIIVIKNKNKKKKEYYEE